MPGHQPDAEAVTCRVLIATDRADPDAEVVCKALRARGLDVGFFYGTEYPSHATISHFLSPASAARASLATEGVSDNLGRYDVVWWRRYQGFGPRMALHPDDEPLVDIENRVYARQLPYSIARGARWINTPHGELVSASKILQLQVAGEVGMSFPETLVTNNRAHAQAFLDAAANAGRRTIFKTAIPHYWREPGSGERSFNAYAYTADIRSCDLVEEDIFRVNAGIFQVFQRSAFEVRAVFMGDFCVAYEHNHAGFRGHQLDARRQPMNDNSRKVHCLSDAVRRQCVALMGRLGLVFGCADLLVTPEGDYVFLEVNPQGQWVWLQEAHPELDVLRHFCDFVEFGEAGLPATSSALAG